MLKKLIIGLAVCASMSGALAVSAEKMDFDGTGVNGAADTLQSRLEVTGFPPVPAVSAFQSEAARVVHAKGFIRKDLPLEYWKHFKYRGVEIPNTLDLRPNLTQIENQGSCGSCWAFSLTATHRDGHALAGKDPGRLSQEWLVDNSTEAAGCKLSPTQKIGRNPAWRAASNFCATMASVSPKMLRRSEWPTIAYLQPKSASIAAVTAPV